MLETPAYWVGALKFERGLAFAIGALWELQRSSKTSRVDTLAERLADLQQHFPKRWRV
jgi:hypothetical protein